MARKGQKFSKYSLKFKEKILKEYFSGEGIEPLGHKHSVPPQTIRNWIIKVKAGGDLSKDKRGKKSTGRPKTKDLTLEDYKERYEILKKYQAFLQARRGKK
jgi:transposase-like protein